MGAASIDSMVVVEVETAEPVCQWTTQTEIMNLLRQHPPEVLTIILPELSSAL
jgi:hypothetical protein